MKIYHQKIIFCTMLIVFTLGFSATAQTIYRGNPVVKVRPLDILKTGQLTEENIIAVVKSNGVDFPLTEDLERQLKRAGASQILIGEIRNNFRNYKTESSSAIAENTTLADGKLVYGKYGCTASKYRGGAVEYTPRGSFVVSADGKYTYNGFEEPSKGTFTVDENGVLNFKGGYLDGGEATPIDRPNKFFLVFPTIPDNRWTCGLVDE